MYSSCKRSIPRNTTWSAIYISLKRNIPKFDTVLLHSNWSSLRRTYLSKIPTDVNALSCGPKTWKISGISDAISTARHPQKSSQHVRACAAGDGAICSKNRIIAHIIGTAPILEMACAYGLRLRLWLLISCMTVRIFKRIRRSVWKTLLESKTLFSSNILQRNPLNFPKMQTVV